MSKIKRVAVVGGSNLKVTDKWVSQVAQHLTEHKAGEVITTGNGGGSLIAEKAAASLGIPNVLLYPASMVDRADVLFTLPGGSTTRSMVRMFIEKGKPVVTLVGETG